MKRIFLPLLTVIPCDAAMVMLNPNADAYIRNSSSEANNNFNTSELLVGRVSQPDWIRSILQFDLSSIPDTATITGVSLRLTIDSPDAGSSGSGDALGSSGFQLFQITSDADFANGANFSYNDRSFGANNADGGGDDTAWTTAGGDFAATSLSTISTIPLSSVSAGDQFTFESGAEFETSIASNLADDNIQFIFRIPDLENSGFGSRKLLRFASGDNGNATYQPLLTVTYDPVPEPSAALLSALGLSLGILFRKRSTAHL